MKRTDEIQDLVHSLAAGQLSRRGFVERALGLGLSLGTTGALLAACGGDKGEAPKGEAPKEGKAEAAKPAEAAPLEKELHIYIWSDYLAEDTVANFEKEFGVKTTVDTYESNEEVLAKLQAGAAGYDIIVPSGYALPIFIALGLVDKLDRASLKNWANIGSPFLNSVYDPQSEFSVPYQWGFTGLAYRKDLVVPPPDSWALFHDSKLKGKLTMMDDVREVMGAFLKFKGRSVNSKVDAELQEAKADAIKAKANLKSFVSAPVKAQLIAGDVHVAQLWNGDTYQAAAEKPEIAFTIPKEGGSIWTDYLAIVKAAGNKRAAHAFIDYVMRPEVCAGISNATGYGAPNTPALEKLKIPTPFPTPEQLKQVEYMMDLAEATAVYDQIWTEIKSA
jgi:spermidine/putrescine-binding protein